MNQKYWLEESYKDVFNFNDLAENTDKLRLENIKNQVRLILEEAHEIMDGVNNNDPVEILDGVADLYVVLNGLTSKLVALGFNVSGALQQTNENNLSKFPASEVIAKDTVEMYRAQNIETTYAFNEVHGRYVIKDTNGKVRKPVGFVSNDLSNCLPEGFSF